MKFAFKLTVFERLALAMLFAIVTSLSTLTALGFVKHHGSEYQSFAQGMEIAAWFMGALIVLGLVLTPTLYYVRVGATAIYDKVKA